MLLGRCADHFAAVAASRYNEVTRGNCFGAASTSLQAGSQLIVTMRLTEVADGPILVHKPQCRDTVIAGVPRLRVADA